MASVPKAFGTASAGMTELGALKLFILARILINII
jgi:hypothetical protein